MRLKDLPLTTKIARKRVRGLKPETIRAKAKIILKDYDDEQFIGGLKRGYKFVKKFLLAKDVDGQILSVAQAEHALRERVLAGEFDKELIEEFDKLKNPPEGRGRKRGPKPRTAAPVLDNVVAPGKKRGRKPRA